MFEQLVVAFLGTGTMGAGMARNVAAAGLSTRVWNRTREKAQALADHGAEVTVCDTVAEAVQGADVVATMLYDADSVLHAMDSAAGSLGHDVVWLQHSTVGVEGIARVLTKAEEIGVRVVDAPVLGTRKPADDRALVVLASGPESLRTRVAPVLDAVGSRTMWVGQAGAGSRLKLAANAWVLTVVEGIAESLTLTRELGLDPRLFLEAVRGSAVESPYVPLKGTAMLDGAFDPAFALSGALKDADLIADAARSVGLDPGLVRVVQEHFARAVDAGHGELDMSATYLAH